MTYVIEAFQTSLIKNNSNVSRMKNNPVPWLIVPASMFSFFNIQETSLCTILTYTTSELQYEQWSTCFHT